MKNLIALFCIASAITTLAESNVSTYTESGNTFGVLCVDIGTVEEAIIAVPWLEPSTGDADIAVTNVIKTAELSTGDLLYYYDVNAKGYKVWQLKNDKTWEGATVVGDDKIAAGSNQTLARGGAILLKAKSGGTLPSSVYLYGQVATSAPGAVTMAQGTSSLAAYTLIAPPAVAETDLNTAVWSGVCSGDCILLPNGKMLVYVNSSWGYRTGWDSEKHKDVYSTADAKIPAGQGAWYVSGKGSATQATVTWKNTPVVGK